MRRAFPDNLPANGGRRRAGRARTRRGAARGGRVCRVCSVRSGREGDKLLSCVVELEVEVVFQTIVLFL